MQLILSRYVPLSYFPQYRVNKQLFHAALQETQTDLGNFSISILIFFPHLPLCEPVCAAPSTAEQQLALASQNTIIQATKNFSSLILLGFVKSPLIASEPLND